MADTKISQLPSATTPLAGAELVPLVQSGATVQTPTNELSKLTAATANIFTVKQVIEVTDNVNAALRITQLGTADALRVEDSTNPDSTPFIIDASGNVGVGRTAAAGYKFQTSGTIGANDGTVEVFMSPLAASSTSLFGNVSNHDIAFYTNNTERARLTSGGNLLITGSGGLGYGTGSGGTVTQLTSKSTSVTLNKTNGVITMNNAALASGASVVFTLVNSTFAATDVLIVVLSSGVGAATNYRTEVVNCAAGGANIRLTNVSASSLSEAAVLNFAVIKAVSA